MKILITGAGGLIGRILRAELVEHELRLLTRSPIDAASHLADVAHLEAIRPAFRGIDSVIHLAAASAVRSAWGEVLAANIVGARNVYEAARLEGVGQVIYASSTHAVAGHERAAAPEIYELDAELSFGAAVEPRPDSLYGASKVFGEALGRWYSDAHGMRVVCLRIGYVTPTPDDQFASPADAAAAEARIDARQLTMRKRMRAIWLSQRDCGQLFRHALAAELPWAVVYGTSDNPRLIWDLEPARRLLGFTPQDRAPD